MTLRVGLHSFFLHHLGTLLSTLLYAPSVRSFYYGPTAQKSQAKKKKGLKKESVTIFDVFFSSSGVLSLPKKKGLLEE